MASELTVNGVRLLLDDDGFLLDPTAWNQEVALALAQSQEGLSELTPEHWTVIHFARTYYLEHQSAPVVRAICKETGVPLVRIFELFPSGPTRGACKVAGLPKPDSCA